MRYPLNRGKDFDDSLLAWMNAFVRYKLTTLSNRQASQEILSVIAALKVGAKSIDELRALAKKARTLGLLGINTYANPIFKLYDYLASLGMGKMEDIGEEDLVDFITFATASLAPASKKNYRIALLNFFSYVEKNNADSDGRAHIYDFRLNIAAARPAQKLPTYMKREEMQRFLKAIDEYPFSQKVAARNRLLVKILLFTGLRVSEILNLKKKDISYENGRYIFHIVGKGGKERIALISTATLKADMDGYLEACGTHNALLFSNAKGKVLSQSYVHKQIHALLSYAGIQKDKLGAHMLRHSFATLLYNERHDLVLVQEALGHASLNTSRIYTHFDTQRLADVVDVIDGL